MPRRLVPALLLVAALVVFASYLAYTQYMVWKIKEQALFHTRIYSLVQRGLLAAQAPGGEANAAREELAALFDIQEQLDSINVPMVLRYEAGGFGGINLPFDVDASTPAGQDRLREYATALERRRPQNKVEVPGSGTVLFGDPPLLAWLRWVPWLQVTGGLVLVFVAVAVIRSEMRAERERLWASMARELAHQMGTPISSLEGWLEVLGLPASEREALATDDHIARVMGADVERLERVSRRFELIGKPPALAAVDVGEIVRELQTYFAPRLPKIGTGITLRTRVEKDLPQIRANRVLLAWALENVVKNAIDALAGRTGRITIHTHAVEDGSVRVHIADDGPGIAPGMRERIFEPGVSSKPGGWGVGLSLSRRIIRDLHGGRISARPRRRGGAVFEIELPSAS